jgi:hypothetical protein
VWINFLPGYFKILKHTCVYIYDKSAHKIEEGYETDGHMAATLFGLGQDRKGDIAANRGTDTAFACKG